MVIAAINQSHPHRLVGKPLGRFQPAEAATNDDDVRIIVCGHAVECSADAIMHHRYSFESHAMTDTPDQLKPGLHATVEIVVGTRDTAAHVGSGKIGVLATPILVTLLESAALQAVERLMPPGQQTVGTRLDISHTAATPVGMQVRAHAELVHVEGRKLTFRLSAEDESEAIASGTHERLMISVDRFDQRMQKKMTLRSAKS